MSDPSSVFEGHHDNISNISFTSNMGTYRTVTKSRAEMVFALQSLLSPLDRIAMVLVKHRRGLYFSTCYLPQIVIRFSDGDKGT